MFLKIFHKLSGGFEGPLSNICELNSVSRFLSETARQHEPAAKRHIENHPMLWLGMASLELWLRMKDEHKTFLELWLEMMSVIGVSVRVIARTEGLHSINQSQVMASDTLILCREYELWFVLETPPSIAECGP